MGPSVFAPLLPGTTSLAYALVGVHRGLGLFVALAYGCIALLASYGLGRAVAGRAGGWLSLAVAAATPVLISYSRSFNFAIAAAAAAAVMLWALARSDRWLSPGWSALAGLGLAAMVLARTMTVAFVPALVVAAVVAVAVGPRRLRRAGQRAAVRGGRPRGGGALVLPQRRGRLRLPDHVRLRRPQHRVRRRRVAALTPVVAAHARARPARQHRAPADPGDRGLRRAPRRGLGAHARDGPAARPALAEQPAAPELPLRGVGDRHPHHDGQQGLGNRLPRPPRAGLRGPGRGRRSSGSRRGSARRSAAAVVATLLLNTAASVGTANPLADGQEVDLGPLGPATLVDGTGAVPRYIYRGMLDAAGPSFPTAAPGSSSWPTSRRPDGSPRRSTRTSSRSSASGTAW